MPIVYDPRDPGRAAIPHLFQLWAAEAILGIILSGYAIIALVIAVFHPEIIAEISAEP